MHAVKNVSKHHLNIFVIYRLCYITTILVRKGSTSVTILVRSMHNPALNSGVFSLCSSHDINPRARSHYTPCHRCPHCCNNMLCRHHHWGLELCFQDFTSITLIISQHYSFTSSFRMWGSLSLTIRKHLKPSHFYIFGTVMLWIQNWITNSPFPLFFGRFQLKLSLLVNFRCTRHLLPTLLASLSGS